MRRQRTDRKLEECKRTADGSWKSLRGQQTERKLTENERAADREPDDDGRKWIWHAFCWRRMTER